MQLAEPETYRFDMDGTFSLAIPCHSASFSSASSNSSSPYEVFTPTSRRPSPNDLRLDFEGHYQSFGGSPQSDLTPPSVMHKYMYPVKAEHERISFSSADGNLPPSTPLRKMSDIMPYDHMLDMNNMATHSMTSISHSHSLPVYTEAPLQPAPYIMTPTQSISPSEMGDNASPWSCNNDSPISFFGRKGTSPHDVEAMDMHRCSQSPMGRIYFQGMPVSPNRLPTQQRHAMVREARNRTTELQREMRAPRKVPEKTDNYDVVRKAMCKCDYPNCQKAFRRNEHLKRHKQT